MKILCSGHLVRHPVGGHSWHHLQYLVGLQRLGHEVTFFEHYGWPQSCYDPSRDLMTADPSYGVAYAQKLLDAHGIDRWAYFAEDGRSHGLSRQDIARACRQCDVYFNLSNINWIEELEDCRRRVLVDTDPVLTQTGAFGAGGPFSRYHTLFTYGENVHHAGCEMPTGGVHWEPTRQPVVLDLWPVLPADRQAPFTTVMNWKGYQDIQHDGRTYGQKDRQFGPYFDLPRRIGECMQLAVRPPADAAARLLAGGWTLADPLEVTRDAWTYQRFIQSSRAEFSLASHTYVATRCGWFSDRTTAYLASGRPAIIQDTGFSDWLPSGAGVIAFTNREEAAEGIAQVNARYEHHCRESRRIAETYFDARRVLQDLLDVSMGTSA